MPQLDNIQTRTLRIYVYKKGTPGEFFTIAPEDEILTAEGNAYRTLTPTADLFVNTMARLKYNKVEFLEPPSVSREADAGMNGIHVTSQNMDVGRT